MVGKHPPTAPRRLTLPLQHTAGDIGASQLRMHLLRLAGAYVVECCENGKLPRNEPALGACFECKSGQSSIKL